MNTLLINGFILGLAANLHCLGMCGPIALAVPLKRGSTGQIMQGALAYNFGRIFTYSLLGMIVGSIGLSVTTIGFLQGMSIACGILLLLVAWHKWFGTIFSLSFSLPRLQRWISSRMGHLLKSTSSFKLAPLGMLNGLLPCGMVFAGLLNAILAANPWVGALSMFAFGLGTLPSMMAVAFAAQKIGQSTRLRFKQVVPYMLTVVGILIILRGMNLDIPWISPHVAPTENAQATIEQDEVTVEMSCCHPETSCKEE